MDHLHPKTVNPFGNFFLFLSDLIRLYLTINEHHKHDQGWNPNTTPFPSCYSGFFMFLLLLFCLTNVSPKYYHETVSDQLSEKHKGVLVSDALGERCVISWSSFSLKREIPWKYCLVYLFFN